MSILRKGTVGAAAVALVLVTAAPSSAGTTQYWSGELTMDVIAQSGVYTSTGGTTSLGATGHLARNQSAQWGYAFNEAKAYGSVTLTHSARASIQNWASWTNTSYVSGKVAVVGKVNY